MSKWIDRKGWLKGIAPENKEKAGDLNSLPEPDCLDVVIYVRNRCPKCKSKNIPVYCTLQEIDGNIIRHHKCRGCGLTFKSVESNSN